MTTTDTVRVKLATIGQTKMSSEGLMKSTVELRLTTEDDVELKFDLDLIALTMLSFTVGTEIRVLKPLMEAEIAKTKPAPTVVPDSPEGL